ncbi:hypothetical protein [Victivallis sp. Marseille-Q1083]|uniref:hypothetical protein n=1 Tax=Victivallis sp. Marseille-Q1083 TaxID=2717288 RepID=UPI00158D4FDE|nr:hypothetical protein [Victivallis sp. Marseille-Q1083]
MTKFKTLVLFFCLLIISGVLLFGINRVERKLDVMVAENNLHFTGQIKNAPPIVVFTTVALGSFRGLLADLLWLRATRLQDAGNYFEMVQLANWITELQPRFSGATVFLAWNMAYNISVTCSDYSDRWRWVQEGIKLIRDKAIDYNPTDPLIYRDLAWIFQHKMGNVMDDANQYYKVQLAREMSRVIGATPDWEGMAKAPAGESAFLARYPQDGELWKLLKQAGIENYGALFAAFKKDGKLPDALLTLLQGDETLIAELECALRADWIYRDYRLNVPLIVEINQKYGELDWRVAESQAIYWATMGLKMTPSHKDINCERVITQSLQESFRNGRVLMIADDVNTITLVPNLNVVDQVIEAYETAYRENNNARTFYSAKINFMKDAIVTLYNYGQFKKAAELYATLSKLEGIRLPLESFVMYQWEEDVRDASVKQASSIISGLISSSFSYLMYGDDDAALARDRIARYIYTSYQNNLANRPSKDRIGLSPFAQMKREVYDGFMRSPTVPAAFKQILQAKLQQEDPEVLKEQTPTAEQLIGPLLQQPGK